MVKLENDYERMIPEYHHGMLMYGEHIMRYESVAEIVSGKVVLDIASGSGYGSATLARTAKQVYGVDINEKAVAYSKQHYAQPNITFRVGSGTDIPVDTGSIDVVVSHETIEHIADYERFLSEVKRVLKHDGQAVISTPNDDEYPEGNHFHLHQFKVAEFEALLKNYFQTVELYYQGAWVSAALLNKNDFTSEWRKPVELFKTQAQPTNKSTYVVAVCSDKKPGTLGTLAALTEPWSDKELRELAKKRDEHLRTLIEAHETSRRQLAERVHELEEQLTIIRNSKSWRYTRPLRSVKSQLRRPRRSKAR